MDKLLLRPKEAAELIGIGRTKVFELMRTGQLESVRIGSSRRIPRSLSSNMWNDSGPRLSKTPKFSKTFPTSVRPFFADAKAPYISRTEHGFHPITGNPTRSPI
jgi:excisionase family DNA binding protein